MASISKRKLAGGKFQWRVSYTDSDGNRKRPCFSSWAEANTFRQQTEERLRKGIYRADAETVTLSLACQEFLAYCAGRSSRNERMTRKTLVVYAGHVKNHILNADYQLADIRLSQLTSRRISQLRDALREAGVSVVTTRRVLATLHTILAHAKTCDWVAFNAADGVRVIGPRGEGPKKVVPPTKEELRAILSAAAPDFELCIFFAASTGLRAGEQWELRWGDINGSKLHVRRRVDVYGEVGPPKSAAGLREIPLSKTLTHKLKEWRMRTPFSSDEDLVFANREGGWLSHANIIKRRFKPALAEAGVEGLHWHALRHFAISSWIEAGLTPKAVQTFAGHSSLQVTMDRYGHLFPSEDHGRAMDLIASELSG